MKDIAADRHSFGTNSDSSDALALGDLERQVLAVCAHQGGQVEVNLKMK